MIKKEVIIGDCRLLLGDCLSIMPLLDKVDAVVTDPPYGIENKKSGIRKGGKGKGDYQAGFEDTPDYVKNVCVSAINLCLDMSERVVLTSGFKNIHKYPAPTHIGTFQYPASCTMSSWGIALWQPILYYGKDPHHGRMLPDSKTNCNDYDRDTDHPCPKPMKQWTWLVERASREKETILDPFMGSGTTGAVCAKTNRKFIGIELEEKYFDIACKRITEAYSQPDLFIPPPKKPIQEELL